MEGVAWREMEGRKEVKVKPTQNVEGATQRLSARPPALDEHAAPKPRRKGLREGTQGIGTLKQGALYLPVYMLESS